MAAQELHEHSLALYQELGIKLSVVELLEAFAALASVQEQPRHAAQLWGAAEVLREAIGSPLPVSERPRYDKQVAQARSTMKETAFAAAWAQGCAMKMEEAIAYALEHTVL